MCVIAEKRQTTRPTSACDQLNSPSSTASISRRLFGASADSAPRIFGGDDDDDDRDMPFGEDEDGPPPASAPRPQTTA